MKLRLIKIRSDWNCLRAIALGLAALVLSSCATQPSAYGQAEPSPSSSNESLILSEGDVISISFPGAPELSTQQTIRRDGKISLPLVGEVVAIEKTPKQLEGVLLELYDSQLVAKEVNVTVVQSNYIFYVSGAVRSPGKITANRPLTAFEALLEAGGYDPASANLKKVKITRFEGGQYKFFIIDLDKITKGKQTEPFQIKPGDAIEVPSKFKWF